MNISYATELSNLRKSIPNILNTRRILGGRTRLIKNTSYNYFRYAKNIARGETNYGTLRGLSVTMASMSDYSSIYESPLSGAVLNEKDVQEEFNDDAWDNYEKSMYMITKKQREELQKYATDIF